MRILLPFLVATSLTLAACSGSPAEETKGKDGKAGKAPAAKTSAKAKGAVKSASAAKGATKLDVPPPADNADESYTYQADGRRDPFQNLLGVGNEPRVVSKKGDGAAGVGVGEITVRAVIRTGTVAIANIQGPDGKNYYVRAGDKLMDGTVKSVTPQGLVVVQEVNDPLSVEKQREVRKLLRSQEDAKQ